MLELNKGQAPRPEQKARSLRQPVHVRIIAGNHQVDLCAVTSGDVAFSTGALTVQWVETTQVGTTATASTGVTPEEKLAELLSSSFGE